MEIYRKISGFFSNFNNKIIRGIKCGKKLNKQINCQKNGFYQLKL